MAIGPRLEFRQSQSLVMTPQLRQAIKLLQFSNLDVSAYVEEELERNPLLERDERAETAPEAPAPDQRIETHDRLDSADLLRLQKLPDGPEADHTNSYDAGTPADRWGGDAPPHSAAKAAAAAASTATTAAWTTWPKRRAACATSSASSCAWASPTRSTA